MTRFLYAQLSDLNARLDITDTLREEAWLDVLESASRWVDDITGHRFHASSDIAPLTPTETRYYSLPAGCDPLMLEIDELLSLSSLVTDANGDGAFEYTWVVDIDYWLGPRNAPAKGKPYTTIHKTTWAGRYWFPSWPNAIKVVGNFGYCTLANLPPQITTLTLMAAESMGRSMFDLNIPGTSSYQVGPDLHVTMNRDELPMMARKIIDLYRVPVFVVQEKNVTRSPLTFRLDAVRRAIEATMISTATVRRLTQEEDTSGGFIDTYAAVGTYPCRFYQYQITPLERESAVTVQTVVYWRFVFPTTADIQATDRLVVGTRVFEVVHDGMGSLETTLVVLALEIT